MQGFYFFVKFCLVLIYILKVYRKKSASILLRKNIFNSLLAFSFWNTCTFLCFERFLCWKSRNYFQIYLSRINNYWDSILTLYITWGVFSLVCFLSVFSFFLSFFLLFFFFYGYFPWQTLTIHKIGRPGERIIIFLVFHFHSLANIHLIHWDFYHLSLLDLFVITRLIADETCFPCILFAFLCMQLSVGVIDFGISKWKWGFELISSYHPSITKQTH